jgi:hypothetical protein
MYPNGQQGYSSRNEEIFHKITNGLKLYFVVPLTALIVSLALLNVIFGTILLTSVTLVLNSGYWNTAIWFLVMGSLAASTAGGCLVDLCKPNFITSFNETDF